MGISTCAPVGAQQKQYGLSYEPPASRAPLIHNPSIDKTGTCVLRAQQQDSLENDNLYKEYELTIIYYDADDNGIVQYEEPKHMSSGWSLEERCYNNLYLIIQILTDATEDYFPKKRMTARQIHRIMDISKERGYVYDISVEDVERILNVHEAMGVVLPFCKDGEEKRYCLRTNAIVNGVWDYSW